MVNGTQGKLTTFSILKNRFKTEKNGKNTLIDYKALFSGSKPAICIPPPLIS
jgi:hypothetical protein